MIRWLLVHHIHCLDWIFDKRHGNFWNESMTRASLRSAMQHGEGITWAQIADQDKDVFAKDRACLHNKSIRYIQSLKENLKIFNDMGRWCHENKIELYILNFPVSKHYLKWENPAFKDIYYDIIRTFEFPAILLDFVDMEFEDEFFNDPDHLNDIGARKLTGILLNVI